MGFISDLLINISAFRIKIGEKLNTLANRIGNLPSLSTTNKTSLVDAINEVKSTGKGLRVDGNGIPIHNVLTGTATDVNTIRNASIYSASSVNRPLNINSSIVNFTPYTNNGSIYGFDLAVLSSSANRAFFRSEINNVKADWVELFHSGNFNPANVISTNTTQNGLSGDKTSSGIWTFGGSIITKTGNTGFPNNTVNDSNNYIAQARLSIINTNNGLHFFGDGTTNSRRMAIQSAHASTAYSTYYGQLDLNPFGGVVKINGYEAWHAGNLNPADFATAIEINNIYDQLSAKANTRLSNLVSDLSTTEKNTIKNKLGVSDTVFILEAATSQSLGGVRLFSDTVQTVASNSSTTVAGRTYPIQFNSAKQMVVNVPWEQVNLAPYVLQSSLNTQLGNYVPNSGASSIQGTKTFGSAPIIPNGTLNNHAVNLGQLNLKANVRLDDLPSDLSTTEKNAIKNKIGISDSVILSTFFVDLVNNQSFNTPANSQTIIATISATTEINVTITNPTLYNGQHLIIRQEKTGGFTLNMPVRMSNGVDANTFQVLTGTASGKVYEFYYRQDIARWVYVGGFSGVS